jgi:hypothetical protein
LKRLLRTIRFLKRINMWSQPLCCSGWLFLCWGWCGFLGLGEYELRGEEFEWNWEGFASDCAEFGNREEFGRRSEEFKMDWEELMGYCADFPHFSIKIFTQSRIIHAHSVYTDSHREAALLCPAYMGHLRRKVEKNTYACPTGDATQQCRNHLNGK